MSEVPYKTAATEADFMQTVIEASATRPVLVDFWAPWCGPCRTLMPMLEQIADDYAGRFTLVKVNTDEEPGIAGQFGIRSIPTVMLFHQGQAVDQFVGVQPEPAIRAMLDKYLAPAGMEEKSPGLAELASAQIDQRAASAARTMIDQLEATQPDHPALESLRARLAFLETAIAEPDFLALRSRLERDPGDSAARHAIAAHHAVAGDYATALAEWLELMRRDRGFGDDAARRSLLMAFAVLGERTELVLSYRRRLASLLH
jgi:putative thioredoxin